MAMRHLQLEIEAAHNQAKPDQLKHRDEKMQLTMVLQRPSSVGKNTNLYRSIKRFSHTDHNWSEEHPENVIHKKSNLDMEKENCIYI
jgi:hypothetical protein